MESLINSSYMNIPLLEACPCMSTYRNNPEFLVGTIFFPSTAGKSKLASSSVGTSLNVLEEPLEAEAS